MSDCGGFLLPEHGPPAVPGMPDTPRTSFQSSRTILRYTMRRIHGILILLPGLWLCLFTASAQEGMPLSMNDSLLQPGRDFPLGVEHGTWDFDEWPGVDHSVVYRNPFRYNSLGNSKNKIDYSLSLFDADDHTGYLRTPLELENHGIMQILHVLDSFPADQRRLLVVMSHPDDDLLLAGGLLAAAARRGWEAHIIMATNGADGSAGIDRKYDEQAGGYNCAAVTADGTIRVGTDSMALKKRGMVARYVRELGVSIEILQVHAELGGEPVREIGEMPGADFDLTFGPATILAEAMRDALRNAVSAFHPSVLITHGSNGEYGSRMHLLVHELVIELYRCGDYPNSLLFTGFPEYNYSDHISHYLDLDDSVGRSPRDCKYDALRLLDFLYRPGADFDRPWDPDNGKMNGVFVKDFGYTSLRGYPPRYEFFQLVSHAKRSDANHIPD